MSQADSDMQGYVDSQKSSPKLNKGLIPMIMLGEEMYRANFFFDKWLKGKQTPTEEVTPVKKEVEQNLAGKNEEDDSDFDDWQGVSREGESDKERSDKENDDRHDEDDDDDADGGVMMPVPDVSFWRLRSTCDLQI